MCFEQISQLNNSSANKCTHASMCAFYARMNINVHVDCSAWMPCCTARRLPVCALQTARLGPHEVKINWQSEHLDNVDIRVDCVRIYLFSGVQLDGKQPVEYAANFYHLFTHHFCNVSL